MENNGYDGEKGGKGTSDDQVSLPGSSASEDTPVVNIYQTKGKDELLSPNTPKSDGTVRMKRQIGLIGGISMIVGTMIGSGIFITPGNLLKQTDSVATSLIVWSGCGLLTTFTALTYCELGTVVPRSGGEHAYYMAAYTPLHRFFGELPAFLFAFMTVTLMKPSSLAIISLTFGQYAMEPILKAMDADQAFKETTEYDYARKLLAAVVALFIGFVNVYSAKVATRVQIVFTGAKITAMLILIGVGVYNVANGEYGGIPMEFDKSSASYGKIAMAFYSGLWSYEGWNNLNFVTEELIEPNKNLPRAILIGIPLTTVFYVLINLAYLSALDKDTLINSTAVAMDVGDKTLGAAKFIIPVLVALSTIGSANGSQFTAGRICYVAARDGHLADVMSYVHATRLTPTIAIMFNTFISMFMILASDINSLIDFFSFMAWIYYGLALASVIVLRYTRPDIPRPIRIPLVVPIIAIVITVYLVLAPLIDQPQLGYSYVLAVAILGCILYYFFVYKKNPPKFMVKFTKFVQCVTMVAPSPYKED